MESCLCLPESPPGLSGAGCQDPGDEPRLLVPSCLPGTQAPLPPSRGPGCPPLYDGEAGGGMSKVETGVGVKVSENLALVISPVGRGMFPSRKDWGWQEPPWRPQDVLGSP